MTTQHTDNPPPLIDQIEQLAKHYAQDRALLAERVNDLQAEIATTKRRRIAGIKSAVARAADSRDELLRFIGAHPEPFQGKAKSITLNGIRCGFQKGAGKLAFTKPVGRVVDAIRKLFQDEMAEQLIDIKETPNKAALKKLPPPQLRQLGCQLTGTEDAPFVKVTTDEIDKFVDKLLDDDSADNA